LLAVAAPFGRRGAGASPSCFDDRHPHPATRQPLAADGAALARFLQQAGLTKASVIRVTGPAGLTATLWLCRHGYERAAYVHANWVGTIGTVDALVAPHACSSDELADLLQAGVCLRDGGVLVAQVPSDRLAQGGVDLAVLLDPLGYQVEQRGVRQGPRRVRRPSPRFVWCQEGRLDRFRNEQRTGVIPR